jgi:hypothetical protein
MKCAQSIMLCLDPRPIGKEIARIRGQPLGTQIPKDRWTSHGLFFKYRTTDKALLTKRLHKQRVNGRRVFRSLVGRVDMRREGLATARPASEQRRFGARKTASPSIPRVRRPTSG